MVLFSIPIDRIFKPMKINKILIANRGEIALRILRSCKEMNIRSAVVYSDIDRTSLHVLYSEEAYSIGASPSSESYLRIDKIMDVAKIAGVDAIHPGYGFLSENAEFAKAVADNNMLFIGPSPETIRMLGDKTKAKSIASSCGVDSVPGTSEPIDSLKSALKNAEEIGYPVLLKAASGGGGKGMRIVTDSSTMEEMFRIASSESEKSFGDSRVFIEKYISRPHHIEFQILADSHGNVVHLGDRECSIQRRYQKIMEESPSPFITDEVRSKMGAHAIEIVKAAKYFSAGTVEFLVNSDMDYYFLEVNTRLQVEHTITEMRTGIDLVKEQIRIAEGNELSFTQEDIIFSGHAIECRITSEDTSKDFLPATGKITSLSEPGGAGIRNDSGVRQGSEISAYYDPLMSKLVVWGRNRSESIARCSRALSEYTIAGLPTSIPFCKKVLKSKDFLKGNYDTTLSDLLLKDTAPVDHESERTAAVIGATAYKVDSKPKNIFNGSSTNGNTSAWKQSGRESSLR